MTIQIQLNPVSFLSFENALAIKVKVNVSIILKRLQHLCLLKVSGIGMLELKGFQLVDRFTGTSIFQGFSDDLQKFFGKRDLEVGNPLAELRCDKPAQVRLEELTKAVWLESIIIKENILMARDERCPIWKCADDSFINL